MAVDAKSSRATMIPALRYDDAAAAVEWLCRAFGFKKHLVVPGEDGVFQLRQDRVLVAEHAGEQRLAGTDPFDGVVPDLVLDRP